MVSVVAIITHAVTLKAYKTALRKDNTVISQNMTWIKHQQ